MIHFNFVRRKDALKKKIGMNFKYFHIYEDEKYILGKI